ncbi:long-chain fatty acid transport protein 2-like [Lineus longissimus]|uniref:long-chain fatty acid transport protein 2-like n=1 Tax=Lineus longissimus TaxID=88925 RepID=UPI002B4CB127
MLPIPAVGAGIVGLGALTTYLVAPWLKTDLAYCYKFMKFAEASIKTVEAKLFMVDMFEAAVKHNPQKTFLWNEGIAYSYAQVDEKATQVARFADGIGLKCGDCVAMMIFNSPEFVWTVYGLQKLGVQVALLNTNIRSKSLQHCLTVSETKTVIFGQDLQDAVESVADFLSSERYSVWIQGSVVPSPYQAMDSVTVGMSTTPVDPIVRNSVKATDPIVYIYTSGTTGLPKAAIITQNRPCSASAMVPVLCNITEDDVVYLTLPLYHSAAFLIGLAGTVRAGCTAVLRRKFSASVFWDDCRRYDVTAFVYIGELLRYLVNMPEQPNDKDHKVRVILGNGLRPEIWAAFKDRFNIKEIREFYAATEGLGLFMNLGDKPGSIGRCSPILKRIYPLNFLKFDYENETAYRGPDGRCVPAKPGETGLYVCAIQAGKRDFDGYKGKKELNEKKILRNVFKEGDAYYNSGDLLKVDDMHDVYFIDRVGDTFRWKGENVSTTEVASVLADDERILHVNVYGVKVPGADGRAGMAAITMNEGCTVDQEFLADLYKKVMGNLPVYARPIFLRMHESELETTSTFKYIKTNLQKEGFNPSQVKEPLYRLDSTKKAYSPINRIFYDQVVLGKSKL